MKNFVQKGRVVDFLNSTGALVSSGTALLVGVLFGIVCADTAISAIGELETEGVFDIVMDASVPTQFAAAYWDNTAKKVTTTATANTKIGVFLTSFASGVGPASGFGRVRLDGIGH